jgi:threonine dehydrogenase-like Zn-dependent dehydrogenase
MGDIEEGDTVVVFGAGPVGIFAAKSAWLLGAGRVIVVDHVEYRLDFVRRFAQCEVVNFKQVGDMAIHIKKMTDWLGADVCIDCVGCEAAGSFAQTLTGRQAQAAGRRGHRAALVHQLGAQGRHGCRSSACTVRPSMPCRSATR